MRRRLCWIVSVDRRFDVPGPIAIRADRLYVTASTLARRGAVLPWHCRAHDQTLSQISTNRVSKHAPRVCGGLSALPPQKELLWKAALLNSTTSKRATVSSSLTTAARTCSC